MINFLSFANQRGERISAVRWKAHAVEFPAGLQFEPVIFWVRCLESERGSGVIGFA